MPASAVSTLVSEEEYLHGHFGERTPEYADGEILERTMPNSLHSIAQYGLIRSFVRLAGQHPVFPCPEIRLRVAPKRYRIVDCALFHPVKPRENVPELVPLVVAEIVSPDDSYGDMLAKLREYHALGVQHIWVIDPEARNVAAFDGENLRYGHILELPEFGFRVTIDELSA